MQPALLITVALLTAWRDRKGAEWCRKSGIGAIRKELGVTLPSNVSGLVTAEFASGQAEAIALLEARCRVCRRCKLGQA